MALKPTIYKCKIALADCNRDYYDTLNLTIAQHPSETQERMMVRVLAYCLNVEEGLSFTKGLSTTDEPDLWVKTLDDQISHWIDVGEPSPERIKKATRQSPKVSLYSFNSKSDTWWAQQQKAFGALDVNVIQFPWESIQALASMVERTMDFAITMSDQQIMINGGSEDCVVEFGVLK